MAHDNLEIHGQALSELNAILGTTGGGQRTFVDDRTIVLAMNANDVIRRSRALAGSGGGVGSLLIRNLHTADNQTITTRFTPYSVAATSDLGAGYPREMPRGFDVWLLGMQAVRTAGAVNLDGARLQLELPGSLTMIRPAGEALAAISQPLWAGETEQLLGSGNLGIYIQEVGTGLVAKTMAVRLPRGCSLLWETRTAATAGTPEYSLGALLGVFPAGLGQDAIGTS